MMNNQKNYSLEEEIDINKNHHVSEINSLLEISNKIFVCGTNLVDIIIHEKVNIFCEKNIIRLAQLLCVS